ncbi:multiubiquitin domain-containing protein [Micromonospora zamorensis]|uniref:multiubiquitin domain-containing protein n=1 Tax=Micromonospora zamorensis TaxID=709883 RepID=UPI0033AEB2B2
MSAPVQEHSGKKHKEFEVVINGTVLTLDHDTVTYEELGQLAFPGHDPQAMFTVTYRHADAPHGGSGTLVAGESVKIKKKGTMFNVRLTTRS